MKRGVCIIFFLLITVGLYLYFGQEGGESKLRKRTKFAIDNVSNIDRIRMKDREGNEVDLKKQDEIWIVNGKKQCFQPKIDGLLNKTLSKIRIKGHVPKAARENVIRKMVGTSTHVEVYSNGDLIRDYYVGEATPSQDASYIHINGAETPYIGHILGHLGIIGPQFSCDEESWYDVSIFDYEATDINKIEVVNNELPNESFTLTRQDSTFILAPSLPNFIPSAVKSYFALFKFKNFEGYAKYLSQTAKDSIKKTIPFMTISVTDKKGMVKKLNIFRKGSNSDANTLIDRRGNKVVQDTERYFATFTGFDRLVTIQDYVFGKLIVKRSFFSQPVE
jgi:hypothetical protein